MAGEGLRKLELITRLPEQAALFSLQTAIQDVVANPNLNPTFRPPLHDLRVLEIGTETNGSEPRNYSYQGNVAALPNFQKLVCGFGIPTIRAVNPSVTEVILKKWGCRHRDYVNALTRSGYPNSLHIGNHPSQPGGQLPLSGPGFPNLVLNSHTHPYLKSHVEFLWMIQQFPNVRRLRILDGTLCDWLLRGYQYRDATLNNVVTVLPGLPHVMRTSLPNLENFACTTMCVQLDCDPHICVSATATMPLSVAGQATKISLS